jgi:hypothetical protein
VSAVELKQTKSLSDFRQIFGHLDDAVLIDPIEFGELLGTDAGGISRLKLSGALPKPAIEKNRFTRWSVGQVREFLSGLHAQPLSNAHPGRRGRPRKTQEA